MEETKVIRFLTSKKDLLFGSQPFDQEIISRMLALSDENLPILEHLPLRQTATVKLISLIPLGFDCFYLGNVKRGFIKYFTFGGFGLLWLKDLSNAEERCRAYNRKKLLEVLKDPSVGIKMIEKSSKAKKAFRVAAQIAPEVIKGAKGVQNTMYIK